MDIIAKIISLEGKAMERETRTSAERWEASRLIWEQLQFKTYRDLSAEIKAAGGKGSVGHLQRTYKCWDIFVAQVGLEVTDYRELGSFYEAYNSDEVRGSREAREREPRSATGKARSAGTDEDFSAHGLIERAHTALSILAGNPAFWILLTEDDWARLGDIPGLVEKVWIPLRRENSH